jgi:hypothetical protein
VPGSCPTQPPSQLANDLIADLTEKDQRQMPLLWAGPPQLRCELAQCGCGDSERVENFLGWGQRNEQSHDGIVAVSWNRYATRSEPARGAVRLPPEDLSSVVSLAVGAEVPLAHRAVVHVLRIRGWAVWLCAAYSRP